MSLALTLAVRGVTLLGVLLLVLVLVVVALGATGFSDRMLTAIVIAELRGTAEKRQIQIRCETTMAGSLPPGSGAWIMFSKYPN